MELLYELLKETQWAASLFIVGGGGLVGLTYLSTKMATRGTPLRPLAWIVFSLGGLHAIWHEYLRMQATANPDTAIVTKVVYIASLLFAARIIASIVIMIGQAVISATDPNLCRPRSKKKKQ